MAHTWQCRIDKKGKKAPKTTTESKPLSTIIFFETKKEPKLCEGNVPSLPPTR